MNNTANLPHSSATLVRYQGQSKWQSAPSKADPTKAIEAWASNDTFHLDDPSRLAPNDLDGKQWALQKIEAEAAWERTTGRNGPLIAVLDTGVDVNHPDLRANIWTNPGEIAGNGKDDDGNGVIDDVHGYNAFLNNGDVHDGGEHGTHVTGIIGARGDNGLGIAGLNWQANIMPIKVFDDNGNSDVETILRAIDYAKQQGANVLSCSWGGANDFNQALHEGFRDFPGLVVCSAGNSSGNNDVVPHYPSSFELDNLVSVAASSRVDNLCFTSCYGPTSVDLAAPGEQVLSTVPGGGYKVKSGTSQATPHVTGTAGLLLSRHPELTPQELKSILISSCDPLPQFQGKVVSGGRLNVAKAIQEGDLSQ